MKNKKNIALIGMPAAGKSTVGVLVAKHLGLDFLDTDILIQAREQQTLAQLIAGHGMERFLDVEARHLMSLVCDAHVIATGGSVVYRDPAMAHLGAISRIVYLDVDLASLEQRLLDVTGRGVAIGPGKKIADLYRERVPLYERYADQIVPCSGLGVEAVVAAVVRAVSG